VIGRKKEKEESQFNIDDRGYNVKAWYLEDIEESKGDALIEVRYNGELIREFLFPSYKIWNIAAHFGDIVDGELSKDDASRGYRIAASTGLDEGTIILVPEDASPKIKLTKLAITHT
jgi:hypothetical protein